MTQFFFDIKDGFITIDGNLAPNIYLAKKPFFLAYYKKNCLPVYAKVPLCPKESIDESIFITQLKEDYFVLSFFPRPLLCEKQVVFQTFCQGNDAHMLTVYFDGEYKAVVETQSEYVEFSFPCRPDDIKIKSEPLKNGCLIQINAKVDGQKLLAIYYYGCDYIPLLYLVCDDFCYDDDCILAQDFLGGMKQCYCTRRLNFCNGRFVAKEVSYSYRKQIDFIDELKPYLLFEYYLAGDNASCSDLLSPSLPLSSLNMLFQGLDCIADFENSPYYPMQPALFSKQNFSKAKYFKFVVKNGYICDIIPL